jgi:hypothetical protein
LSVALFEAHTEKEANQEAQFFLETRVFSCGTVTEKSSTHKKACLREILLTLKNVIQGKQNYS